jgi:hypothetical protein
MADGRKNNGGHSTKGVAGRKPKAEEQKLIEKLSPFEDKALKALKSNVEAGESWAIKLFFEYMYGKPKQSLDHTSEGEKIEFKPFIIEK